jgi:hemoglobin/transferrin/lactoferrin receptor protein
MSRCPMASPTSPETARSIVSRVRSFASGVRSATFVAMALAPAGVVAQSSDERPDTVVYTVDPLMVTATRGERALSTVPRPVTVVTSREFRRELPNTVSDLFRTRPGLDVAGVGVNQARPQIRGLKGQRVLLLSDGLRLNNSRRQTDFGELLALVDVNGVERVEVVRGPASVLYGSDALGGVINVITRAPTEQGLHGSGAVRYGSVEEQYAGTFRLYGRFDAFSVRAGGSIREADAYSAPSGSFGDITLADDVIVDGTGTRDQNFDVRLGYDFGDQSVFGTYERYDATDSGFGSVDPAAYDPAAPDIRITYPQQTFNKLSVGYRGDIDSALIDHFEVLAYGQQNARELRFGIGPFPAGPGFIGIDNLNTTNVRTWGGRAEARKLMHPSVLLTWGVDAWRDAATGTDLNTTTLTGFGPTPIVDVNTRPQLPDAEYLSLGAFVQSEVEAGDRVSFVAGARYQYVTAETFATPGLEDQTPVSITDGTFVASLNSIIRLNRAFSVVGTVGRGFRSPNLIERFFDGPTPEGSGYQVRNPELGPETSLNFDAGVRFRQRRVGFELFGFRNVISDGIRIAPTGEQVGGLDGFTNVNVDELLFRGVEFGFDAVIGAGVSLVGSYTWLDTEDVADVDNPVGEAFSTKMAGTLRYDAPGGRFWLAGEARRNGEQVDPGFRPGNPIGTVVPSFSVLHLRGGMTVWRSARGTVHRLNVSLTNLTNTLYAEFSNAGFFRPEPKRNLTLAWQVDF